MMFQFKNGTLAPFDFWVYCGRMNMWFSAWDRSLGMWVYYER